MEPEFYIYTPALPGTYVVDNEHVEVRQVDIDTLNQGMPLHLTNTRGYPVRLIPRPIQLQERI